MSSKMLEEIKALKEEMKECPLEFDSLDNKCYQCEERKEKLLDLESEFSEIMKSQTLGMKVIEHIKCGWCYGLCGGCDRIVCEHEGDDVAPLFCLFCYETGHNKSDDSSMDFRLKFNDFFDFCRSKR